MNKNENFHDGMTPELDDDALESVAGGRGADEYNYFGTLPAQADTVKILLPLHSRPAEKD